MVRNVQKSGLEIISCVRVCVRACFKPSKNSNVCVSADRIKIWYEGPINGINSVAMTFEFYNV